MVLALALVLTSVQIGMMLPATSEDAIAREPRIAPARYPSLTDYLSMAQDESLIGGNAQTVSLPIANPEISRPSTASVVQAASVSNADATNDPVGNVAATTGDTVALDSSASTTLEQTSVEDITEDESADEPLAFLGNILELFSETPTIEEESSTEDDYASTEHRLYLKYLLADSRLVSEGDTIDDVYTDEQQIIETVIAQYSSTADLLDPGPESKYYLALMDTTRFLGNTIALDAAFAKTNNMGEVIHGPIFDRDTGIAYVPKSLYANERDLSIVAQILLSYDLSSNPNVVVDVHIDNDNADVDAIASRSIQANALDITTTLPVTSAATASNITMNDLTVYLNGSDTPYALNAGRNAVYDRATGELTIFCSPMNLFSVEVDIAGRTVIDKVMRATTNTADAATDPETLAMFPGVCFGNLDLDTLAVGDWFRYDAPTNYVWPNPAPGDVSGDVCNFCAPYSYGYANDPETLYAALYERATTWDDLQSVGLLASSGYFNCVIGTPDGVISGQDWSTDTWPATSDWSTVAGGHWAHLALECGHVSNSIGTVPTTAPYSAPIGMRILSINLTASEPYIIVGFVGSKVATQSGSGIYKFRVNNPPKYGGLRIEKRDAETKQLSPQGDASLDPTKFEITYVGEGTTTVNGVEYPSGSVVMELTTAGGVATTSDDALKEGTYAVREVTTGMGYRLSDTNARTFEVTADSVTVLDGEGGFHNQVMRGGLEIEKRDAESRSLTPQGDASLDGTTFEIINRSSGSVYVDGRTYRSGEVCSTLTIANGKAATSMSALPYGTYGIRETKAGAGYLLTDTDMRTFQIRSDKQIASFIIDDGFFDEVIRGGISIEKRDLESRLLTPLGGASLDGTVFEITNESRNAVLVDGAWADPGQVCLRLTIDEGCASSAKDALPYGTYSIREVLPGAGYLLTDAAPRTFTIRIQDQMYRYEQDDAFYDQVKRGDIMFLKVREQDMARLAGIPFSLTSQTTGESHVLVTDANGRVDTSNDWMEHTSSTNANDEAIDADGKVDVSKLNPDAGVWFGKTTEDWLVATDDGKCALPYDTYTLEELPCPANEGLTLVTIKDITVQRDLLKIDMGTIDDKGNYVEFSTPNIMTSARDGNDSDRIVNAAAETLIVDEVKCTRLSPREAYVLRTTLMDASTNEAIEGARTETEFVADSDSCTISVDIEANLLGHEGTQVVVFEELVHNGDVVAEHKDMDDSGQTVIVAGPRMKTFARGSSSQDNVIFADAACKVIDTVSYEGLATNVPYTLEGTLMLKSDDGSVSPLADAQGHAVTAACEFVPDRGQGQTAVEFVFDSRHLVEGCELVVFEKLILEDEVIVSHENPNDADQTLTYASPLIESKASDRSDGDKIVSEWSPSSITDDVLLTNVVPGKQYGVLGVVMDPSTGLPAYSQPNISSSGETDTSIVFPQATPSHANDSANVEKFWDQLMDMMGIQRSASSDGMTAFSTEDKVVSALEVFNYVRENGRDLDGMAIETATVTPTRSEHAFTMDYELDSAILPGDYVVCNVVLADDEVTATHLDLANAYQAFSIVEPMLSTQARDKNDGDNEIAPLEQVEVIDTVAYSGLVVGKEYVMQGFLMDKSSHDAFMVEDQRVESETRFTPNSPDGTIDMAFMFDASAITADTELVVFEQLFAEGVFVAEHADLDDAAQTIIVRTPNALLQTGDALVSLLPPLALASAAAAAIIAACGIIGWRRRLSEEKHRLLLDQLLRR